jgi:hypothetical protein
MAIVVLSPFSGRPVQVREADLGRAVRDESGRVFYPLPRPDGAGFYASTTRAGSPRDLQRYADIVARQGCASGQTGADPAVAPSTGAAPAVPSTDPPATEPVYDATGGGAGRSGKMGRRIIVGLAVLAAAAGAAWLLFQRLRGGH